MFGVKEILMGEVFGMYLIIVFIGKFVLVGYFMYIEFGVLVFFVLDFKLVEIWLYIIELVIVNLWIF